MQIDKYYSLNIKLIPKKKKNISHDSIRHIVLKYWFFKIKIVNKLGYNCKINSS